MILPQNGSWIRYVDDCWIECLEARGVASFGRMLQALNEGLSRSSLFQDVDRYFSPTIIFITDGGSTNEWDEWKESLDKIEKNGWFSHAIKLALAIEEDADIEFLRRIVGEYGAVVTVDKANVISSFLSYLSVSITDIISEEKIDRLYPADERKNTTAKEVLKRTSVYLGYPINYIGGFDERQVDFSLDCSRTPAVVIGAYSDDTVVAGDCSDDEEIWE